MNIRALRIKSLIENSKKTYLELEKETGIKKSSLQRYATGITTKIPLDVIEKLSAAFNVSQEYLMGWDEEPKNNSTDEKLTDGERMLLDLFNQVPAESQEMVLEMIRIALKKK